MMSRVFTTVECAMLRGVPEKSALLAQVARGNRASTALTIPLQGACIAHATQQSIELSILHRYRPIKTGAVEAKAYLN